jgi:hypothetical protein
MTQTELITQLIEQARRARALRERVNSEALSRPVRIKAGSELLALVESISITAESMLNTLPDVGLCCWNCGQRPNPTEDDLAKHIEVAAASAPYSWPRDAFIAKLRAALGVGDRVVWVGAGFANIRRRDGRIEAIFQRS